MAWVMNKVYLMKNQGDLLLILLYVKVKLKRIFSVILLEKVMTSLGTHLVKNFQSHSRIIKSLQKTTSSKLKMFGSFCNQAVTESEDRLQKSLLQFTETKIYIYEKKMRGLKCASLNNSHLNSHRNHTNRIFYNDIFITIDRSLSPTGRIH